MVMRAVPPSSKSAQSYLGPPVVFATGLIKVARALWRLRPTLAGPLKPSENGNRGRCGTSPDCSSDVSCMP